MKEFFEKVNFEKFSRQQQKHENKPSSRVNRIKGTISLDPDKDRQNVGPYLDPNCLTSDSVHERIF